MVFPTFDFAGTAAEKVLAVSLHLFLTSRVAFLLPSFTTISRLKAVLERATLRFPLLKLNKQERLTAVKGIMGSACDHHACLRGMPPLRPFSRAAAAFAGDFVRPARWAI